MVLTRVPLFVANWTGADAAWSASHAAGFNLKNGVTFTDFEVKVMDLNAQMLTLSADEQNAVLMQATRDASRAALHATLDMWRKGAIYALSG